MAVVCLDVLHRKVGEAEPLDGTVSVSVVQEFEKVVNVLLERARSDSIRPLAISRRLPESRLVLTARRVGDLVFVG